MSRPRSPRPAPPISPDSPQPPTSGPAAIRNPHRGHRRARVHHAARPSGQHRRSDRTGRVPRPGRCAGRRHHAAGGHLRRDDRSWPTPSPPPGRRSGRSASTPASWACSPATSVGSSTSWVPPGPGSWSPATSTSSPSRRCAPNPSTATASAPRWSPARAHPRRTWCTNSSKSTACRYRSAAATRRSHGGRKEALRLTRPSGTVTEEVVYPAGRPPAVAEPFRVLTVPLVRGGDVVVAATGTCALAAARELVASRVCAACRGRGWPWPTAIRRSPPRQIPA